MARLARAAAVFLAAGAVAAPAARATDTTIGFDDLGAGVEVTNQYTSDGVSFGNGSFGAVLNCDNPVTQDGSDPAPRTDPNFARLGFCQSGRRGVAGGFSSPRSRVSLFTRELDSFGDQITLRGYDASQNEILSRQITADQSWQQVHIDQAPG